MSSVTEDVNSPGPPYRLSQEKPTAHDADDQGRVVYCRVLVVAEKQVILCPPHVLAWNYTFADSPEVDIWWWPILDLEPVVSP